MTLSRVWVVSQDSESDGNCGVCVFMSPEGAAKYINGQIKACGETHFVTARDLESRAVTMLDADGYAYLIDCVGLEP